VEEPAKEECAQVNELAKKWTPSRQAALGTTIRFLAADGAVNEHGRGLSLEVLIGRCKFCERFLSVFG